MDPITWSSESPGILIAAVPVEEIAAADSLVANLTEKLSVLDGRVAKFLGGESLEPQDDAHVHNDVAHVQLEETVAGLEKRVAILQEEAALEREKRVAVIQEKDEALK